MSTPNYRIPYGIVIFIGCVIALVSLEIMEIRHSKRVEKIFNEYEMKMDSLHKK